MKVSVLTVGKRVAKNEVTAESATRPNAASESVLQNDLEYPRNVLECPQNGSIERICWNMPPELFSRYSSKGPWSSLSSS